MSVLGIDFGTSFSSASCLRSDGLPQPIKFSGHDAKIPSVVSFYGGTEILGYDAEYMLSQGIYSLSPEEQRRLYNSTAQSIKRDLSRTAQIAGHSHLEIITLLIKHIKIEAEKSCDPLKFDSLILTHPVMFEEWKKDLYRKAAQNAGFQNVELLQEPVSAALGYLQGNNKNDVHGMLIYDFGAGTFDIAYVTRHEGQFIVPLPPKGDSECGGDDIDQLIYNYLVSEAQSVLGQEYQDCCDLNLLLQCRRWKEMLSSMSSVPVSILSRQYPGKRFSTTLTREKFETIISPIIEKTVKLTKNIYDEVKANMLPLDFILLIGGSSAIPLIKTRLNASFPDLKVRTTGESDIAVALGASYYHSNPININPEKEWCYCMYDGKKILRSYNFCIYCGKSNFYKTHRL